MNQSETIIEAADALNAAKRAAREAADAAVAMIGPAKDRAGSYAKLAEHVGATPGYWANVVAGRTQISPDMARRLAEYMR